ncbi:glycoside hydrolase family 53 protein [Cohnella lupini]|uniref:Arabinogalactan endo-beta-1,4-galactanase n=1 Tax=Cohnella lupini TaxID=1294267 RepID=A0A3D9IQK9_9BACL|nr:arabinogalactan endo-1,4-beta-galactosidase [Cohnella lupini]RED63977.1 arabinogalactan endo-1,4-beta-galactosidase [Cohnella lupini]
MARHFLKGMDISFTDEIEAGGGSYFENGEQRDILDILQRSGVNSIRLRIWNDPAGGYCNLERTLAMAKRIKSRGLHFLLDFHYSDRWADPANQWKPKAWEDLNFDGLLEAVRGYTHEVLSALAEQGTLPDMVQVGNEITPGMLWDDGKVDGEYDTDDQWEKLTDLVNAGVSAVRAVDPGIELMIHIDRGGDWPSTLKFLERFERHEVDFDVIGQSFYPWWHGTLRDLRDNLTATADRFGKPIIVVETAYPWTLDQTKGHSFIVGSEDQLHEGYPATVEGQAAYLRDFAKLVADTPDGLGIGFHWWEPAWIPSQEQWSVGHPNNWANLTLFDFEGNKLHSLDVCGEFGE